MSREEQRLREFEESTVGYADLLFRIAYARLGNAQDAEDVVQDTYLKAFRSIAHFENGSNMKAWLTQILINTIRDRHRKYSRVPATVQLDESFDDDRDMPVFPDPQELLCNDETDPALATALKSMSETLAIALIRAKHTMRHMKRLRTFSKYPKGRSCPG